MESRLTRRSFNSLALCAALDHSFVPFGSRNGSRANKYKDAHKLVHPGMLHSKDDLMRIREAVQARSEPIVSSFEILRQHPNSQLTYRLRGPVTMIGRNPTVHADLFDSDCNAAYQCALMWCITGNRTYAEISIRILNEWASTLKEVTGADAVLCASLGGFKLVNAAELIRYTDAGWDTAKIQATEGFFRYVLLPVLHNFAPFANGNWDTAAVKCLMAIGIFSNDINLIDEALRYYLHGCGDGRLENYIYPGGQCQESGRDQQHTQLGLAHMGDTCEMAWNQGLDLYGVVTNRLLEGFEYTAKYNLGLEVPFAADHDKTGKYTHQAISPRSSLRPVYEQIFNHYVHRKKMAAPYTQLAAEKLRPEGAANGADHTGFGTLLYSRVASDSGIASARATLVSLYATGTTTEVRLEWLPSYLAKTYTISRSDKKDGSYKTIAEDIVQPTFRDRNVIAHQSYYYRVAPAGEEHTVRQISTVTGLPRSWAEIDYGQAFAAGSSNMVADALTVQAFGAHPFGDSDELHFVYSILVRDGILAARLSPLLASQVATAGLMVRAASTVNAPMAALAISPSGKSERPQWLISLLSRESPGGTVRTVNVSPLDAPYGRIVQPVWMRLSRNDGELHALFSYEGKDWMNAGKISMTKDQVLAGCFACSGLGSIPTQVTFEQLMLESLSPG